VQRNDTATTESQVGQLRTVRQCSLYACFRLIPAS